MRLLLTLLLLGDLAGCVSLQSVSLTQIPEDRSHRITAEASKFMVLYISFDNDFVDEARDELKTKCKNGRITGILTKDETVNYFLGIFTRRRVKAEAFCVK